MKCKHEYKITEISNVLQQDDMGYPLVLCIEKCNKCNKTKQSWIDVDENCLKNLKTGQYVLCKWKRCN